MAEHRASSPVITAGRYILVGLITVTLLGVTWLIIDFLFNQLSRIGRPWVTGFARRPSPAISWRGRLAPR